MSGIISDISYVTNFNCARPRLNNKYEIIFVTEGSGKINISGDDMIANKNDIIFIGCNDFYKISPYKAPFKCYVALLDAKQFEERFEIEAYGRLFKCKKPDSKYSVTVESSVEMMDLFSKMLSEKQYKNKMYAERLITIYLEEICIKVMRHINKLPISFKDDIHSKILMAQNMIDNNYSSDIKISEICRELFVSNYYFSHKFTEIIGMSPKKYLMNVRLKNASKLLLDGTIPINEVAEKSGFNDADNFKRYFKSAFGVTPKMFQKTVKNQQ